MIPIHAQIRTFGGLAGCRRSFPWFGLAVDGRWAEASHAGSLSGMFGAQNGSGNAEPLTIAAVREGLSMYSTIVDTATLPWTALDFPGVSMRVIHQDKKSGGMTVMTRVEPGASIPAHLHTRADETVFVVSGDFVEETVQYGPGSFFAAPAGVPHGPHRSSRGCIVLTTFSAPLDFQIVQQ